MAALAKWIADESDKKDKRIRELELEFASQGVTLAARNSRIAELEAQLEYAKQKFLEQADELTEANKAKDEAREVMESVLTMIWHTGVSEWLSKHGGRG